jgi:ABC-type multidrug transport system fused ATPase/permease subunit
MSEKERALLMQVYLKAQRGAVFYRTMGKSKILMDEFYRTNDKFLNVVIHIVAYCWRWMVIRIAFFNAFMLLLCLVLPYLATNHLSGLYGDDMGWKIPLGLRWSYRVVIMTGGLMTQIAIIANDMLSAKRLEEYFSIKGEFD